MFFNKTIPEFDVTNLEVSVAFYKTCGFQISYERKEDKFVFLSLGEIQFMLQEMTGSDQWSVGPLEYPFGRGINFQLEVDNVQVIYDSLVKNGYPIFASIEDHWYRQDKQELGNREFLVQDPDGYLLRFTEDLGSRNVES